MKASAIILLCVLAIIGRVANNEDEAKKNTNTPVVDQGPPGPPSIPIMELVVIKQDSVCAVQEKLADLGPPGPPSIPKMKLVVTKPDTSELSEQVLADQGPHGSPNEFATNNPDSTEAVEQVLDEGTKTTK